MFDILYRDNSLQIESLIVHTNHWCYTTLH